MNTHQAKKAAWYKTADNSTALRQALSTPLFEAAFSLALQENLERFKITTKLVGDKIIAQSSLFDQMKGWNDCLNFLQSLALPPKPDKTPIIEEQYPPDYVTETFKANY